MDSRHQSGHIAELYVAYRLACADYKVSFPHTSQSRYDLIGDLNGEFFRIQVKKATWSKTDPYEYLQCRLVNKCTGKHYDPSEVDIIAITDLERVWMMPIKYANTMTSVCLDGTNPKYKSHKKYNPQDWLL